ncbi:MAG: arsenic resistance protein, partial [Thermoplasmatota archaeon]
MGDEENDKNIEDRVGGGMTFFEKYLTVWVAICIVIGVAVGRFLPIIPDTLGKFEYAQVNIPIAVLIWFMIYPAMAEVDFKSILGVKEKPRGLIVTWTSNWIIKPFIMYGLVWFFMTVVFSSFISPTLQSEYIAGAVLLGAAPCTAMVFVW